MRGQTRKTHIPPSLRFFPPVSTGCVSLFSFWSGNTRACNIFCNRDIVFQLLMLSQRSICSLSLSLSQYHCSTKLIWNATKSVTILTNTFRSKSIENIILVCCSLLHCKRQEEEIGKREIRKLEDGET